MDSPAETTVVVPCYNEARRLDEAALCRLAGTPGLTLLFVNDGSTDATADLLDALAAQSPSIEVEHLPVNAGKAAAVRHGLRAALASGADIVGYYDADLATPPDELLRLCDVLNQRIAAGIPTDAVLGSRVLMLGRHIDRKRARHYLGRVFATVAAVAVGAQVYDTQCGAKVFVATDELRAALDKPFWSRWAFDVELLGRLVGSHPHMVGQPATVIEEPLMTWVDVPGSAMSTTAMLRAGIDVAVLAVRRLIGRLGSLRVSPST